MGVAAGLGGRHPANRAGRHRAERGGPARAAEKRKGGRPKNRSRPAGPPAGLAATSLPWSGLTRTWRPEAHWSTVGAMVGVVFLVRVGGEERRVLRNERMEKRGGRAPHPLPHSFFSLCFARSTAPSLHRIPPPRPRPLPMRALILAAAAAAAAASLATGAAAEPALLERFTSLDAWKHSSDEKYGGAFTLAGGALTVRVGRVGGATRWPERGIVIGRPRGRGGAQTEGRAGPGRGPIGWPCAFQWGARKLGERRREIAPAPPPPSALPRPGRPPCAPSGEPPPPPGVGQTPSQCIPPVIWGGDRAQGRAARGWMERGEGARGGGATPPLPPPRPPRV